MAIAAHNTRHHVYIRPILAGSATFERDVLLAERAMEDSGRYFPAESFRLPATELMIAERNGDVLGVQPFYRSLVLGSPAWFSAQSNADKAVAMRAFTAAAYTACHRQGLLDVLAFSNTPETRAFALRNGYQKADHPALRLEVR